MGYDISHHAVDTRLFHDRLIPGLLGDAPLEDLFDRATHLRAMAHRANQWGLRCEQLDSAIRDKQDLAGPKDIPYREKVSGLPGFDADLCVWGRPYFILADNAEETLAALEQYLSCADLAAVDRIARSMLDRLETKRGDLTSGLHPSAIAALNGFYPLHEHLPALQDDDARPFDVAMMRKDIAAHFELYTDAWAHRETDRLIESERLDQPTLASDLARGAPYALLNLSALLLPGWMGRGYVWPTALFKQIGVSVSHIFETPAALFGELLRAYPNIEEQFSTTIENNYSLGGYVKPENISALKALLQKHRKELILAWDEFDDPSDADRISESELDEFGPDFKKIIEPVLLAERKGYGFIEAAEIYSGFMGVMN